MSAPRFRRVPRRRLTQGVTLLISVGFVALTGMLGAGAITSHSAGPAAPAVAAAAATVTPAYSQTQTVSRTNLINGQVQTVESLSVKLTVDVTNNLIGRQPVRVSWTGAHPSGGIKPNPNDAVTGPTQEYPMVLLQCHGVTGSSVPLAQQIQPEDCWTSAPTERFFGGQTRSGFPVWRLDQYASTAQRALTVNQPNPVPSGCAGDLASGYPAYWLPYVTSDGTTFPIGPAGCAGMPSNMSRTGGLGGLLPSNETFASTDTSGNGNATFTAWDDVMNNDLGCSHTVACALVAVPIMGFSCDPAGSGLAPSDPQVQDCEKTGFWPPGKHIAPDVTGANPAVEGSFWWAASNWRNRFVVPLTFAQTAAACSTAQGHSISFSGSELMAQAFQQWQPHFCLDSTLFPIGYVGEAEPAAARLIIAGAAEAALLSFQPASGFSVPVAHAPIAATGFAISFVIDDANGNPVTTLQLTPRLLAKLLTESYPAIPDIAAGDPELYPGCPSKAPTNGLSPNPLNITLDPEFQALNPGIKKGIPATEAASTLLMLQPENDVVYALTSYINADPAARAWLNGTADPWGMTVNCEYKGIPLPVSHWPTLSTYEPDSWIHGGGGPGDCYRLSPTAALLLIANPVGTLDALAQDVQFSLSQSQDGPCVGGGGGNAGHLAVAGQQQPGFRFMIGITALGDAHRFDLGTASLLTYTKPGTPAKFTNATGMTFVAPTDTSLASAAALLTVDKTNNVWAFPYSDFGTNSTSSQQAYPGFMLVYADIPTALSGTSKLPQADATDYSKFLTFATTTGQTPGSAVGNLPSGYLPMTAANHLDAQVKYAAAAAVAIGAQNGTIPPIVPSASPSPTTSSSASHSPSPTTSTSGSGGSQSVSSSASHSASASASASASSPTASPLPSGSTAQISLTPAANFGVIEYVLPAIAGLALVAAAGSVLVARLSRSRGK